MKSMISILIAGLGMSLLLGLPGARAAVIFDNGVPDISQSALFSDFDRNQQIADNFFLLPGATTLTSVEFWGVYAFGNSPQPVDEFAIRIFQENAVDPFEEFQVSVIRNVTTEDFQFAGGGPFVDVYRYIADIPETILSDSVTLWLSIINDTTIDTNDGWAWINSAQTTDTNLFFRNGDSQPWSSLSNGINSLNNAFVLNGPDSIPEPSTLVMFAVGLAGLGLMWRRKVA